MNSLEEAEAEFDNLFVGHGVAWVAMDKIETTRVLVRNREDNTMNATKDFDLMLTEHMFLSVIRDCCEHADHITLNSTMAELDQVSGDETSQLFCEMVKDCVGVDSWDYDDHPVLADAWNRMEPWRWTHVGEFYEYVAHVIEQVEVTS